MKPAVHAVTEREPTGGRREGESSRKKPLAVWRWTDWVCLSPKATLCVAVSEAAAARDTSGLISESCLPADPWIFITAHLALAKARVCARACLRACVRVCLDVL